MRRGCRQVVAGRVFDAVRDGARQGITSVHVSKIVHRSRIISSYFVL
jgi:hypothetical protein